jgi:hypothetical protein
LQAKSSCEIVIGGKGGEGPGGLDTTRDARTQPCRLSNTQPKGIQAMATMHKKKKKKKAKAK